MVEEEAVKNYSPPPPAFTAADKEYAATKLGLDTCMRKLKRKEVTDIKYKIRGPMGTQKGDTLKLLHSQRSTRTIKETWMSRMVNAYRFNPQN